MTSETKRWPGILIIFALMVFAVIFFINGFAVAGGWTLFMAFVVIMAWSFPWEEF